MSRQQQEKVKDSKGNQKMGKKRRSENTKGSGNKKAKRSTNEKGAFDRKRRGSSAIRNPEKKSRRLQEEQDEVNADIPRDAQQHEDGVDQEMEEASETEKAQEPVTVNPNAFESLVPPLSDGVLDFIKSKSFHAMTPVQAATIPLFLTNKDVAVQAVTGSGKTLAFVIPCVEMILRRVTLLRKTQVGAIILSPTRELAHQTFSVASEVCQYASLPPPLLLVGGSRPVADDLRAFAKEGNDIVIATPGRLEDVLTRYDVLDVMELDCLILDEADVLLDMGFDLTLSNIMAKLPRMRRTGLFSATGTSHNSATSHRGIKELMARAGMRNPVWVNVAIASAKNPEEQEMLTEQATPSSLSNYYLISPLDEKLSRLVSFLRSHKDDTVIVFFLTCACVEFWGLALQQLASEDLNVELLHGKLVQKRREKTMERFRETGGVLCCTDVAARGLDVSHVNWVVQFDAPKDPSSFVHRVGRSARAGRVGSSLLFLAPKEESYIDLLLNRKVPLVPLPSSEECVPPPEEGQHPRSATTERQVLSSSGAVLPDILEEIRQLCMSDRDFLEKGTQAFTSYVRAYKEHHCAFIFRFASLDLGLLATSFSLLRLPKMPELRDKGEKLSNFTPAGPEVNIYAIPFRDKVREAARQKRLVAELAAGGKNAKQIKAEQRQAELLQRKKEKRTAEVAKGRNPHKKRGRQAQLFDEWDDLAKEERLFKKLRKKQITQEQYDGMIRGAAKDDGDAMDDTGSDSD